MTWFWKSIGIDGDLLAHWGDLGWQFHQPLALWIGLPLLVPIACFIYYWQRRNLRTVHGPLRLALTTIRVLILLLLVLVLAGPYVAFGEDVERRPIVALLFDHSQSMQLEAGPFEAESPADLLRLARAAGYRADDGPLDPSTRQALNKASRAQLASSVVKANAAALLGPLTRKYDVQYYSVAQDSIPLSVADGQIDLPGPEKPRKTWGSETRLGDAINKVFDDAHGTHVSGILVFSDGQNTGGASLKEVADNARKANGGEGAPIFAVPVGTHTRLKDVAVADVFTTGLVTVGDTARVAVTVESQGFDGRAVKVELLEGEKVLDTKELVLRSTEQQQVELTFQAKEPGPRFLTVKIPEQPEEPESLRSNNKDSAFVRVTEDRLRVLYLEGLPRWDFRFLKNAMRRDSGLGGRHKSKEPDLVLEAEWRRLPAARQEATLPKTLDELAEYHTIILGDASPALVNSHFLDLLAKAVREKGVGLVVEAGPLWMPHKFDDRLLDLLPVRLEADRAGIASDVRPFQLQVTPDGSVHEAMRFYDDPGRNQNAWEYMPPFYWCAAAVRLAPAATPLAWNGSLPPNNYGKVPLIAHQYAGQGRVMFVGTDSTWLWRQNVGDRYFYKFWGQAIRFVARRDPATQKKSWMEVRPLRAQPGERASIELMAFAGDGSPLGDKAMSVQVSDGKAMNTVVNLTPDSSMKGRYTGNFMLENAGEYTVTYLPGGDAPPVVSKVRVTTSLEELRHPNVNRKALQALGDNSGGRLVELPDLATRYDTKNLPTFSPPVEVKELTETDTMPDDRTEYHVWRAAKDNGHGAPPGIYLVNEKGQPLCRVGGVPPMLQGEVAVTHRKEEKDIWDNWLCLALLIGLYSVEIGLRRLRGLS
jgi:hypothetical protein